MGRRWTQAKAKQLAEERMRNPDIEVQLFDELNSNSIVHVKSSEDDVESIITDSDGNKITVNDMLVVQDLETKEISLFVPIEDDDTVPENVTVIGKVCPADDATVLDSSRYLNKFNSGKQRGGGYTGPIASKTRNAAKPNAPHLQLPWPYSKYYDVTAVIGPGDWISDAFKNYPQFTILGEAELKEKYEPIFDEMNRDEYWGLWVVRDESDDKIKLAFSYNDRVLGVDADEIVGIVDDWKYQQIDKVMQGDGEAVEKFAEFCGLDIDGIDELDGDEISEEIDEYAAFLNKKY